MAAANPSVLVVDDEQSICDLLCDIMGQLDYTCEYALTADAAVEMLKQRAYDVALVDIKMPGMSGLELLDMLVKSRSPTSVIIVSAVADINVAVDAMKKGAKDYILKPFSVEEVRTRVAGVLRERTLSAGPGPSQPEPCGVSGTLDAIARGVEAQVNRFDFHGRIVTERTVEVAKRLGLPDEEIKKWASARREFGLSRETKIDWITRATTGRNNEAGETR